MVHEVNKGGEFSLRNVFNMRVVAELASRIKDVYSDFDLEGFVSFLDASLESLSFGDRSHLIRDALVIYLPDDFLESAEILEKSLLPEMIAEPEVTDWDSMIIVPLTEYVALQGISHFDVGMELLKKMTSRCTSEWAIRYFILKYGIEALVIMKEWASDSNLHVRRLVSEGTRPRLPLGIGLSEFKKDPTPIIELLELLKDDVSLYVRRSVANNLNDISKDNADVVVTTLKKWMGKNKISGKISPELEWIVRHALRTLIKQGHRGALELLGYKPVTVADLSVTVLTPIVSLGKKMEFSVSFVAQEAGKLIIDYEVDYVKATGKYSSKVFKAKVMEVAVGERVEFSKKHLLREMSTRKHYLGVHYVGVKINGKLYGREPFDLVE